MSQVIQTPSPKAKPRAKVAKTTGNKKPVSSIPPIVTDPKRGQRMIDECVRVFCDKSGRYLATIMPKALVLCENCPSTKRSHWVEAKKAPAETAGARKMRKHRAKAA